MATSKKRVTTPKDWSKRNLNIRLLELPSGAVFRVRNVDLQNMLTQGYLPLALVNTFLETSARVSMNARQGKSEWDDMDEETIQKVDEVARKLVCLAVLEPRISMDEETSDDVINVNDLPFQDCLFIFANCVSGGALMFSPFRGEGQLRDAPGQDESAVREKAV